MAPTVMNTYGNRNQKRRKSWEKISRALKEIGNSEKCLSLIDDSFVRKVKKIKGGKTGITAKGVGLTSKRRTKKKSLKKDFSQKHLKTDTSNHTVSKEQSGSELSTSLDISYDTTFDRLRKAEPLQKLQPATQCTSCGSSSGTTEQVDSSFNCSLFPPPRVTKTNQNASAEKSSGPSCSESRTLTDFRVTSTPKVTNRVHNLYSPSLSPVTGLMLEKPEASELEAQNIISVDSIERTVSLKSNSRSHPGTQNDNSSVPLFATLKSTPSDIISTSSDVIELSKNILEPAQISLLAKKDSLRIISGFKGLPTPFESQNHMLKDSAILRNDNQAEVTYEQISLPAENQDSLEIISVFKSCKAAFESHVSVLEDSLEVCKDIHVGRNSEHQFATNLNRKQAVVDGKISGITYESENVSSKVNNLSSFKDSDTQNLDIHSSAAVNVLIETNTQLHRESKMLETTTAPKLCVSPDIFADSSDSVTSKVCSRENSAELPDFLVSNDISSLKSSNNIFIQEPKGGKHTSSSKSGHEFVNTYSFEQTSQIEKYVSSRINISCDSRLYYDTSENINPTSCKCQGSNSKASVQDSASVSDLMVSKHERLLQTDCLQATGKLDGSVQETSLTSTTDSMKKISTNLPTDVSYQGTKLETDRELQPLGTQVAAIKERADTPSPARPSCRRLSHLVLPQNIAVGSRQASTSFREVYSDCAGRMPPCVEDEEEEEENTSLALLSIPIKARQAVLHRCCQTEPIPFSQVFPEEFWNSCRKIGEGVYGEVFLSEAEDGGVFKVIPIEGDKLINEEPQKKYQEILSEIVIAMELSALRNGAANNTCSFSEVKKCLCVKGRYPKPLIQLWEEYDADKCSENDCPAVFEDDQLYIILVLANGGQDLEAFCFTNADQALSVFKQIAYALAVAESALEFEHRDLHWGNVLVAPTSIKSVSYKINGEVFEIATKGIQATIIDFTLSRMTYDGCCIFNDLARDPTLFTSEGDYQFEVYRLMRDAVTDHWQNFEPFTNVLWLHYLLHKMITMVNYRRTNTKIHQKGISEMKKLSENILSFSSSTHLVLASIMK